VGLARGLPGQIGGNSWPFGALGHRLQLIAECMQTARDALLLRVGLVGQLAARLMKQVCGLATGFGDHGLSLVFRDTNDVLAGIRRTVSNRGRLIFGGINRAACIGGLAARTGCDS
jgi:hypothetical protein